MTNTIIKILNLSFMSVAPLILAALGGVISERSGVINIGLEGIMCIGAFAGACVGYYAGNPWLALIAAGTAGAGLALLHAVASITFRADQTVSGIAINFIGAGLAAFLCRLFFDGSIMSRTVQNKLPKIWIIRPILGIDAILVVALLLAAGMWFFLYMTKWGLRLISVGEHPAAADTLGINVYAVRYGAVIMSGVFAGFGGAARSISVVSQYGPSVISGHGFIALAAVIFGKWTPHGAVGACLLFGFFQALVALLSGSTPSIWSQIIDMIPYCMTIIVLVLFVGKAVAPAADGVPYEKGKR